MPKAPRSEEDINRVKKIILESALAIILEEGFNALSMRKIGSRTSMTAANIYNYFSSKDEIYLSLQKMGFEILYSRFAAIISQDSSPDDKFRYMAEAYISFGRKNPGLYEVMFTRNTPKYSDYIGTGAEKAAKQEKETAMLLLDETEDLIHTFNIINPEKEIRDIKYRVIQIWTALHGLVSLCNSRVLQEVDQDIESIIMKISKELLLSAE